jgi:hypothetical protein
MDDARHGNVNVHRPTGYRENHLVIESDSEAANNSSLRAPFAVTLVFFTSSEYDPN